jgi:ribosome maturation factor RimP
VSPSGTSAARLAAIRAAIEPVLAAHAVELCDLAWTTERQGLTLRLTIERPGPEGEPWTPEKGFGVTLDDCAEVSRDVSSTLDAAEVVAHHYTLEVSSPGLDRPLHGARDFKRFRGALVKVKLSRPAPDGQRVLRGLLAEAADDRIAVMVDGKRIEAPIADVVEANLVFELAKAPKAPAKVPGKGPGAKGRGGDAPPKRAAR